MCGLIGIINRKNNTENNQQIIDQYQDQITRGQQGFGIVTISKNSFKIHRATHDSKALLDLYQMNKEQIILFHHRYPTSTNNKIKQTHPIYVSHPELKFDWYIMHNGVISNDYKLKNKHENELGYVYTTNEEQTYTNSMSKYIRFNDSESFAIELARHLEKKSDEITSQGGASWIAFKINKKTNKPISILWGTNGKNPLDISYTKNSIFLGSKLDQGIPVLPDMAIHINVEDIFNPKKKQHITDLLHEQPIIFAPPPPVMGFNTNTHIPHHKRNHDYNFDTPIYIPKHTENNTIDPKDYEPMDELDLAIETTSERLLDDITDSLLTFFENIKYEETTPEEIEIQVENFKQLLTNACGRTTKTKEFLENKKNRQLTLEETIELNDKTLATDVDHMNQIF